MPASARALAPASMAASSNDVPGAHQRRSVMPATRSSSFRESFRRFRLGASRSSNSAELTATGASTLETASKAALSCRNVALPINIQPLFVCRGRSPVRGEAGMGTRSLNYAPHANVPHIRTKALVCGNRLCYYSVR